MITLSNLKTVAECDGMLQLLANRKAVFQNRQSNINLELSQNAQVTNQLPAQITSVQAQLTGKQAALATTTDEAYLATLNYEINALENQLYRLRRRENSVGGVARCADELDLEELTGHIALVDATEVAVLGRKTELEAAAAA